MKQVIGLSEIVLWAADKESSVDLPRASGRIEADQWLARDGGAELSAACSVEICTIGRGFLPLSCMQDGDKPA